MLQKFVYITGALDFLVGAATWASALLDPQPGLFVPLMTLGTSLMMAAALLMWASKDMIHRAPVIFWQGLVRVTAATAILYGVSAGLSENWEYGIAVFDGIIATVYLIGIVRVTGGSIVNCLLCRTPAT